MRIVLALATFGCLTGGAVAQVPDTVFLEEFTWPEVRDALTAGTTTVIIDPPVDSVCVLQ